MRLWTLHPRLLDGKGLVAAWREALLAQKVLAGGTNGYRNHPQLIRFRAHVDPLSAISCYLSALAYEATRRGYHFDHGKIVRHESVVTIEETDGQLRYEWRHLMAKLVVRSPELHAQHCDIGTVDAHPLFHIVPGDVRDWEKITPDEK
jgi:hypothetical protein